MTWQLINGIFIGRGGGAGYSVTIPQKLILTADTVIDELDATTGWSCDGAAFAANTSEVKSGNASLKCTSSSGTTTRLSKTVDWNFSSDSGATFKLWVYPHTAPTTTFTSLTIYFGKEAALTNHYRLVVAASKLIQNQWNLISMNILTQPGGGWITAGSPSWSDINYFRVSFAPATGQVAIFSFDLIENHALNKKAAVVMFDDLYESQMTKAYPYLKSKNMVATVYAYSNGIGGSGLLTSAQLITLNNDGWDIANHTKTHPNLTTLNQAQVETEFNDCKGVLDGLGLTRASLHVAYPGGSANATTDLAVAAIGAKTGRGGLISSPHSDYNIGWPYRLTWGGPGTVDATKVYIDNAINQNACLFLCFHNIVDSGPTGSEVLYSDFTQIIDYIESCGLQTLTIDEYYRLYAGAITVNHK